MGSWSKTCGLSNLHIHAGTPVYVFVLEENQNRSDTCYTTGLYRPVLLPFESVYNDYGGGCDSGGIGFNLIMESIRQVLVEVPQGKNQYHDIAVTKAEFGESLFFDAVHESRLQIYGNKGATVPVTFTMFRKDIVDAVLENRVLERYVGNNAGTCGWGKNYVRYKFSDIVDSVGPLFDAFVDESNPEKGKFYIMDVIHKYRDQYLAAMWLNYCHYRYSQLVDVKKIISVELQRSTPDALAHAKELALEYLKGLFIESFMEDTRKTWIPSGHEGSQSAVSSAHRLLANTVIAALDRERAEWEAETLEDEDEYED